MKEQDEIENLFRSTFDDFAVAPPASVKESIDLSIVKTARKPRFPWFFLGAVVIISGLIFGFYQLNSSSKSSAGNTVGTINDQAGMLSGNRRDLNVVKNNESEKHSAIAMVSADSAAHSGSGLKTDKIENTNSKRNDYQGGTNLKDRSPSEKKPQKAEKSGLIKKAVSGKRSGSRKASKRGTGKNSGTGTLAQNQVLASPDKNLPGGGKNSGEDSQGNETVPGNDNSDQPETSGNKPAEQKNDPATQKDTTKVQPEDSSAVVEIDETPDKEKNNRSNSFLFSLRTGTTFGFNQVKASNNTQISEKGAFFIQGEATYFLKPKMGLTSGLNYELHTENIGRTTEFSDTVMTGYDEEYVYDSTMTTIIDTIYTPVYENVTTKLKQENSYKLYAVSIPVLFMYSFELSPKLNLDLSAGGIVGLQGSRVIFANLGEASPVVNKFGFKACVRTQLRYQFSAWGVSLNTNFGYDIIPVNSWSAIKRSRTYLDLGVGVHYMLGK